MTLFHIGVGANIQPQENIVSALRLLQKAVAVVAVSPFYWSDAVGKDGLQSGCPPFLNGVCVCDSDLDAMALKRDVLREVEARLGRVRTKDKYANRPIDLDILLWGTHIVNTPTLRIPDPDIFKRAFVALPLFEVAGNIRLPGATHFLKDVLTPMDVSGLRRDDPLTARLNAWLNAELERKDTQ
ncbi:MAG: 2-amino-4-hydroxy-6-hydroxymethyldihydropteridine diphosphokinase [Deltaproteobacteria bacterium]|nr:2-amino-4-hydroxy-6-hydroxymethyldihydropteridine diphosphokinase [Deltaproteobacteria bacterium]